MIPIDYHTEYTLGAYRYVSYTHLTEAEKTAILTWRNHPSTRQWMFNPDPIPLDDHLAFIERLKTLTDRHYWMVKKDGQPMGGINLIHLDAAQSSAEIGYFLAPDQQGRGLGLDFLYHAVAFAFDVLQLSILRINVMTANHAASLLNTFLGFDYLKTYTETIQGSAVAFQYGELPRARFHANQAQKRNPESYRLYKTTHARTLLIAELSANHGHKLETAIETIRAAKRAGADAIKLQTYTADTLTIPCDNPYFTDVLRHTPWEGRTLYELYQEAYTPWEWHETLFRVAREEGLLCFSSPFDRTAVDFLESFNPPAYKIASFEIQDIPLIEYTASKGRPMILSTGIATLEDIELAVETCRRAGNTAITLLTCTSAYPAPIEDANLVKMNDLKQRFGVEVGLSDHTLGMVAPVVAVTLGARVIEKHFILDKTIGGPDAGFSLDESDFTALVSAVRQAEKAMGTVTYQLTDKINASRTLGRSLFVVSDIKAGEPFTETNVRSIRPGFGLPPKHLKDILGKVATTDLSKGTPLTFDHVSH